MVRNMETTPEQTELLTRWNDAKQQADIFKREESTLRDAVVKSFANAEMLEGTETFDLPADYKLKISKKLDYKLSNKNGEVSAIHALLSVELAEKLIKWTPELSVSTYKNLDTETQYLFNACLVIKPAKATVEIVAPKEKETRQC